MDFQGAIRFFQQVKFAVSPAAEEGANRMARKYNEAVKRELSKFPHPAHTMTQSPPGAPPGMISGNLRASVLTQPAVPIGNATWQAKVGPHTVYAAIQEFGGVMHAHGDYMSWMTNGRRYFAKVVELPARPYMRPAAMTMSRNGVLTAAAKDGIASVLYAAEGI